MSFRSLRCLLALLFSLGATSSAYAQEGKEPLPLIPRPRTLALQPGFLRLTGQSRIVAKSKELEPLAKLLSEEIFQVTGVRLAPDTETRSAGDLVLEIAPQPAGEAYTLDVDRSVRVQGGNYQSVAAGTVTLLQSLRISKGVLTVPRLRIQDAPAYPYRGALLDLARKYHSPDGIQQVIELCRLYKIRFLHLHLTDDQLFMFPSQHFPQLGRSNHEFARFEPGSKPHIAPYTLQELKQLEQFAKERGVCLVPEIDLPGHSGRLIADAPDLFGIPGNGSTVNIASPKTLEALTQLLNEVMDVFQSTPYIHLGADEVGLDGLEQTADYREAQTQYGIQSVHDLYCKFVADMCAVVAKRGKKPLVWEEACNPDGPYPLPKGTLVMVWSQGRNPNDLVKRGYSVVNATWTPLYIVRDNKRALPFLFDWMPTQFGREGSTDYTTLTETENLKGAQLCSWENSEAIEIQSLRDRLALVAERVWNPQAGGDFAAFQSRLAHTDALLEKLVQPIAIQAQGAFIHDENTFTTPLTLTLTPRRPGLTLKYTFDNSLPNAHWQTYTGPLTLDRTVYLRAGLFDKQGRQQGYLIGSWFRSEIPMKPNLATNKPVTVGPSPDRTDAWSAKVAVDGRDDDADRHWASVGVAPQWLQVDLEKVVPINFINVITYWDGSRYYQWNAEVSVDGKVWKKVLDFSENKTPASATGYSGKFALTDARYVRINMLKNSANPYVHIVELIVDKRETPTRESISHNRDLQSDTWVATDGLGRTLPGFAECGPPRPNKVVGIFYFLWMAKVHDPGHLYDNTQLLAAHPDNPQYGPEGAFHWWGEPHLGYYRLPDDFVIRKHAQMLTDAGVDVIVCDVTNAITYDENLLAVCRVFEAIRKEGRTTPRIAFLANSRSAETVQHLYDTFYAKNLYPDLWFRWKGKPLLMAPSEGLSPQLAAFFTLRQSWAWTDPHGWFGDGKDKWPWIENYPQQPGWHESKDKPEEISVCTAQHATSNIGRSFHDGKEPPPDQIKPELGLCFEEQCRQALKVDPEFVFITGWNEWIAQRFVNTGGAHFLGHPLKVGETFFVDQYNQEYSRDIEPMKGGHGDDYYYQMVAFIRHYKGVRPTPKASAPKTIHINADFKQWANVGPEYLDDVGDTTHRDAPGFGGTGPYINNSGRNDFETLKIAHDNANIAFYVRTHAPITP
ncbi:MAG TPA: family 20 glycosylhydrolase, partial [Chthonomonadaceae bacterium]|nr:family 20 glycosylhydrolase [Chthonomonadaceae bacterium]